LSKAKRTSVTLKSVTSWTKKNKVSNLKSLILKFETLKRLINRLNAQARMYQLSRRYHRYNKPYGGTSHW